MVAATSDGDGDREIVEGISRPFVVQDVTFASIASFGLGRSCVLHPEDSESSAPHLRIAELSPAVALWALLSTHAPPILSRPRSDGSPTLGRQRARIGGCGEVERSKVTPNSKLLLFSGLVGDAAEATRLDRESTLPPSFPTRGRCHGGASMIVCKAKVDRLKGRRLAEGGCVVWLTCLLCLKPKDF